MIKNDVTHIKHFIKNYVTKNMFKKKTQHNLDVIAICKAKQKNGALREIIEYKITGFDTMHEV